MTENPKAETRVGWTESVSDSSRPGPGRLKAPRAHVGPAHLLGSEAPPCLTLAAASGAGAAAVDGRGPTGQRARGDGMYLLAILENAAVQCYYAAIAGCCCFIY